MLKDRLVAHRGYQQLYPENTLLAIRKAIEAGARYIEIDVMFSADGVAILYHDITLQRVSAVDNAIHRLSADELLALPAFEPGRLDHRFQDESIAPLSALPALLKQHPEVQVFVELKKAGLHFIGRDAALNHCQTTLREVRDQCVLISYDREFILLAHQLGWPSVGVVLECWEDLQLPILRAIQPQYLFVSQRHVPANAILDFGGATLVVYEVGETELAIDWFRRGVDMVETFNIGAVLNDLAHRAL